MTHRRPVRAALGSPMELSADPESSTVARDLVRELLAGTKLDLQAILLVTSELVTNAVVHAGSAVQLTVRPGPPVRIEVRDLVPLTPLVAGLIATPAALPSADATGGRGFPITHLMATRVGADDHGDGGKTIWAEFAASERLLPSAAPGGAGQSTTVATAGSPAKRGTVSGSTT
jgi:anti-sigma regulatory factor (Ser/Thr protein kinase)